MLKYFSTTVVLILMATTLSYGAEGFEYAPDARTLALWQINEGNNGNTIVDASPNRFDGKVEGRSGWDSEAWKKDEAPGKSFAFDGTTVINIGNVKELINPSAITLEAWVYPKDLSGWRIICSNWGGTKVGAYHLACENAIPKFHVTTDDGTAFVAAAKSLQLNRWYHVVGTYDSNSGKIQLYINGELMTTNYLQKFCESENLCVSQCNLWFLSFLKRQLQ